MNRLYGVPQTLKGCSVKMLSYGKFVARYPLMGNETHIDILDWMLVYIQKHLEFTLIRSGVELATEIKIQMGQEQFYNPFTKSNADIFLSGFNRAPNIYQLR